MSGTTYETPTDSLEKLLKGNYDVKKDYIAPKKKSDNYVQLEIDFKD